MIHLKIFETWDFKSFILDKGDFHIVFQPKSEKEQKSITLYQITRKMAISNLLKSYPGCKILKIQKVETTEEESDVVDLEDED